MCGDRIHAPDLDADTWWFAVDITNWSRDEILAAEAYLREFDPPTVLALLGEVERLWRERETLAAAVRLREEARKASAAIPRARPGKARSAVEAAWAAKDAAEDAHAAALALLDGEKGGVSA